MELLAFGRVFYLHSRFDMADQPSFQRQIKQLGMNKTYTFADCTIRVDKITYVGKCIQDRYPAISIRLEGSQEVFLMPYAQSIERDAAYRELVEQMKQITEEERNYGNNNDNERGMSDTQDRQGKSSSHSEDVRI
jgi:hypothetical protein